MSNVTYEPSAPPPTTPEMLSKASMPPPEQHIRAISNAALDSLAAAKLDQAAFANRSRGPEPVFAVGDRVLLSTLHRRRDSSSSDSPRVAKFLPRYDGPYTITKASPAHSSYTLDLPNTPGTFPTFHARLLKRFVPNDDTAYPTRKLERPGPVVNDGLEEWVVDAIVAARRRGRGWQFRVRWAGWGQEDLRWLPFSELQDCEALDTWLRLHPTLGPRTHTTRARRPR